MQRKLASNGASLFPNAKEESLVLSRRGVKSHSARGDRLLCAEEKSSYPFQEGSRQMQVQICVQGHLNLSWDGRLSIRLMGRPGLLDRSQIRLRCAGYAYQIVWLGLVLLSLETSAAKGGKSRRTLAKRGSPTKRRAPSSFTHSSTIRSSSTMCFSNSLS